MLRRTSWPPYRSGHGDTDMPLEDNRHSSTASTPAARRPRRSRSRAASWVLAAAASLGALTVANSLLARRSEARHPPDGKFITVDGVRLHYRSAGRGPAIVLLHGNGVASDDFLVSGVMERLAPSAQVIAFDRPGFGYSDRPRGLAWSPKEQADLLWEALMHMGVERPTIVGHSWGAFVAAEMALAAPDQVSGLVLLSGYYRPTARPDSLLLAGPALPIVGDVLRYTVSPVAGRLIAPAIVRRLFAPAAVTERFKRLYPVSQSLRPGQLRASAAEAGQMMAAAASLAPRLPALQTPTLVIAGAEDRLVNADHQSGWLADQLAAAIYRPVAGAGHMVHHTATDEVANAIADFAGAAASDQPMRTAPQAPRPQQPASAPVSSVGGPPE